MRYSQSSTGGLLRRARDGHTTLTLLLLAVHEEGEGEGRLTQAVGLGLQLLELTSIDTAELEEEVAGSGGLTTIDVTADHDRQMLLTIGHCGWVKFDFTGSNRDV